MKPLRWSLIVVMLTLILGGPVESLYAKGAVKKGVTFSGKNFRNQRVKMPGDPNHEVVVGTITAIDRNGVYLDGEYFRIGSSKIITTAGNEATLKSLHVGLKLRIGLRYGVVDKTHVDNFFLRKPPTKAQRERINEMRERKLREKRKRAMGITYEDISGGKKEPHINVIPDNDRIPPELERYDEEFNKARKKGARR